MFARHRFEINLDLPHAISLLAGAAGAGMTYVISELYVSNHYIRLIGAGAGAAAFGIFAYHMINADAYVAGRQRRINVDMNKAKVQSFRNAPAA